ncbi:hypothetical protein L3X38_024180 [Prunus dulcis]|uniref:Uncharacterized protein n=1 Tax=Prunus dulcis TaxID=3755 RepID=A0AAD4W195_PRUDU|nr:hypothetical protein L3X38_024180 [Prunus dulcis]
MILFRTPCYVIFCVRGWASEHRPRRLLSSLRFCQLKSRRHTPPNRRAPLARRELELLISDLYNRFGYIQI